MSIVFLKQKISIWSIISILISFSGIIVISTHGNIVSIGSSNTLGIILTVGEEIHFSPLFGLIFIVGGILLQYFIGKNK